MKKTLAMALAAGSLTLAGAVAANAADIPNGDIPTYRDQDVRDGVKIGYLDCTIGGGVGYVLGS
ncbi:MAG: DUF992 domain-containing protein, partial [Alphaproteobacteria bacterium]